MKVSIAQVSPNIGDLKGNTKLIKFNIEKAIADGSHVVVFPELVTVGYPPRDLLYNNELWNKHDEYIKSIHDFIKIQGHDITAIIGGLHQVELTYGRKERYNAAYIIDPERIRIVHKRLLPCYDVFDETRYFKSGIDEPYIPIKIKVDNEEILCDVIICEDMWNFQNSSDDFWMAPYSYGIDPVSNLKGNGPIFIINGSPFWMNKIEKTRNLLAKISYANKDRRIFWVNQVGGYDDIIFGGYSTVFFNGAYSTMEKFREDFATFDDKNEKKNSWKFYPFNEHNQPSSLIKEDEIDNLLDALVFSVKEYCRRTGFSKIVFGASGGIDSAVVGAIASIALGGQNCTAITMPSPYSSEGSINDAEELAKRCEMGYKIYRISDIYESFKNTLQTIDRPEIKSLTDENIQPRVRGTLLMAEANDTGALLLSTGNKSELSVGYCTIYGDMAGGYALISDVPKTIVYKIAERINIKYNNIIPTDSITKPPSAELKPGQKDIDSLPPYEILDPLLEDIVNEVSSDKIIARYGKDLYYKILKMVDRSEFKRFQAPPGPKVMSRSFGSGRRIPIAKKLDF